MKKSKLTHFTKADILLKVRFPLVDFLNLFDYQLLKQVMMVFIMKAPRAVAIVISEQFNQISIAFQGVSTIHFSEWGPNYKMNAYLKVN